MLGPGPGDEVVLFMERLYTGNGVFDVCTIRTVAASTALDC